MSALATQGSVVAGSSEPVLGSGARPRSGGYPPVMAVMAVMAVERDGRAGRAVLATLVVSRVERALLPVLASAHATRLFPIDGDDATGLPPRAAPV